MSCGHHHVLWTLADAWMLHHVTQATGPMQPAMFTRHWVKETMIHFWTYYKLAWVHFEVVPFVKIVITLVY